MLVDIKLDKDFERKFNELKSRYGEPLRELNGLGERQLNFTEFIDSFVDHTKPTADTSIDGSANTHDKDVCSLEAEMMKPYLKLLAFSKIHYEMHKKYGLECADEWLENEWDGHFYLHDAHSSTLKSYCYAYELEPLVTDGMYFVTNFNISPPQHLETFVDFVREFVSWASNRSSGAAGLPNFLIYSFYFWKLDTKNGYYTASPEVYRDQQFQRIIYQLNQPYLRVTQSAFSNFSIFDREYLVALFGGKKYPDGSYVIDYIEELIEYQKAFMQVCSKIRAKNVMTFPVLTFCLLRQNGKFVDEEFARWASKHNMQWGDSNFFISEDVTSLSNCCFSGNQKCLTRSSEGVALTTFKELIEGDYQSYRRNLTIFHNGSWVQGKPVAQPSRKMYKIITANKKECIVTDNHIFPTIRGDVAAHSLTTNDYLMVNCRALNAVLERDKGLTYEEGLLIGAYLGDGSISQKTPTYTPSVHLSLNKEKNDFLQEKITKALNKLDPDCKWMVGKEYHNVYPVVIRSFIIRDFIKQWTSGDYSYEKELNLNVLEQSKQFRRGILDGLYATDGGNSNRIYSVSEKLIEQIEVLLVSLGKNSVIDLSDRTDEPVIIRGEEYSRNFPIYCIRWYTPRNKRKHKNSNFRVINNCEYYKIMSIEEVDTDEEQVYCFEMKDETEPYFTLPNGIITHNCRLKSDIKNLGYFNSIGGTALEVGSVKVNTINWARLAYENSPVEFFEALENKAKLGLKLLDVVRSIIMRNNDKGLLPNYKLKAMNFKNQYNTEGVIGIYEAACVYNFIGKDHFGNTYWTAEGLEFISKAFQVLQKVNSEFECDYSINIEQIPAERAAAILMEKDKIFFPNEKYELPLYGNQWIPLGVKTTLHEKIRVSALLDKACSGGSIAHINLDAPFNDEETAWDMLNYVADIGVTYFAFCVKISACRHNHGFYGDICPQCGEGKVTTYQRVVGFITPEKSYSKERKAEFAMRDWFSLDRLSEM